MNTLSAPKKTVFYNYCKTGVYLFSLLSAATFCIYLVVHILLFQNTAFDINEVAALLKMIGVELIVSCTLVLLLFLAEQIDEKRSHQRSKKISPKGMLLTGCLFLLFAGVNAQPLSGTSRDAGTGMQTTYRALTISKAKMIMNSEVLGHAQIPLGEKFTILNEDVSGFVKKEGKVSIGCSLKVRDSKGKLVMQMADLFAAKDIFTVAESKFLKCIISTGKPMQWDQLYEVTAVFWDKWGDGKITNKVMIQTIDLP